MPFSLGQILGGWKRKGDAKKTARSAPAGSPHSPRSRLTLPRNSGGSDASHASNEVRPLQSGAIKNKSEIAWKTIISPHISEKGGMSGDGRYIFQVAGNSNKPIVKRAIEERYGVEVNAIRVINMPAKPRRRGQMLGEKAGFKKAIIILKEGQSISEF